MVKKISHREISARIKEGQIRATAIIEIAGIPRAFVDKTIRDASKKLNKEKIIIIKMGVGKAKAVGDKLFSGFIEVDFLAPQLSTLIGIIADYLPSSIEITEPEDTISEESQSFTELLNDIIAKLHGYDQALKIMHAQQVVLKKELAKYQSGLKRNE